MNADDNNSCHSRTVVYVSSTRSKLYLEGDTDLPLTDTSKGIQSEALLTSTRNEIQTEQHERGGTWWACLLGTHHRVWESINMHKMRFVFTILFPAACEERNQAWVLLAGQGISQGYCQGYCHITHTHQLLGKIFTGHRHMQQSVLPVPSFPRAVTEANTTTGFISW